MVQYNIEIKQMTYSLLEFYNSIGAEVCPKFYDEKFARIMFTSFIGSDKIAKNFQYEAQDSTVLFMKSMFHCLYIIKPNSTNVF